MKAAPLNEPLNAALPAKIKTEIERLEEDCTHSAKSHFNASARWTRYNSLIGVPSIILSALAGTAFFKDYSAVAGLMTSAVAVLTALMTFLKPAERASEHKKAGDQYLTLRNDARIFREIEVDQVRDAPAALAALSGFTKRRNELNQASPQFSDGDRRRARAGIEQGEATHVVDRNKS
ncbi:hypothetical protein RGI145_02330 [Roseomonas gilardii]|uniref:SMODS and SLOG-associating 2TM effector domain-containing protein n=2 Tax=Roseomonas gilardii TaxID=257708 RepID=A0A1L7ABJ0_9PROT|nr:hypothetical protein RGI145_02330 [Roseomonas gilardii]